MNLKVALDWTVNTNHSGFYVAREKGFYAQVGLEVELMTPDIDNYTVTPAKKVELGMAHMALCPLESILSYNTKSKAFDAVAIASLFREDVSAIVVLEDSGLTSPKDLDGKTYASYKARYEDKIVQEMIKNDGGKGNLQIAYPEKLGIWETLWSGKYDATWVFMNWEGIHAEKKGIALRAFKMKDFGIPYGYSPVIMAGRSSIGGNKKAYRDFLQATKKGFLFAKENPQYAVDCITPYISKNYSDIDLLESQRYSNQYYGNTSDWGQMEKDSVMDFLNWLYDNNLETQRLQYNDLIFDGLL